MDKHQQKDREAFMKLAHKDVVRHLAAAGFKNAKIGDIETTLFRQDVRATVPGSTSSMYATR